MLAASAAGLLAVIAAGGAGQTSANPIPVFRQYCFQCHGKAAKMGGINLEDLAAKPSFGDGFRQWEKVALALEQKRMPPAALPQPDEAARAHAVLWIRASLKEYAEKHDGEPGRVTMRRLTSGEYAYTIRDLTGLDLDTGIDASADSAGGEGFSNFGEVQFMQDANLQRYLEAAKRVAGHAVIGAGPLEFFADPGKTGFELSAITRIRDIYAAAGFRTVSGEGGRPFGLEKYGKAFYSSWRYRHRAALGEPGADLDSIARREAVSPRFARHIWDVLNRPSLGYPASEVAARWRNLPAPGAEPSAVRAQCEEIRNFLVTWPSWLFARGDVAAGGAGDESPLEFNDATLKAEPRHHFTFNAGGRGGRPRGQSAGSIKVYLNIAQVIPDAANPPLVIWRNPTIAIRRGGPGRRPQAPPAPPAAGETAAPSTSKPAAQTSQPSALASARPASAQTTGAAAPPAAELPPGSQNPPAAPAGLRTPVNRPAAGQPAIAPSGTAQTASAVPGTQPSPQPVAQSAAAEPATAAQPAAAQPAGRFGPPPGPKQPLRSVLAPEAAAKLHFGENPSGPAIGPEDFASSSSVPLEIPLPEGAIGFEFQADAEIAGARDQVLRVTISDREDGGASRGRPAWALLADPAGPGYQAFKSGVLELASILPPNSHGEPTPADKDPVPAPFDNTYNVPEHDEFVVKVKYLRDDRFVVENLLDDAARLRLNQAWNDLYASFEYHDNYLRLLAQHFKADLKGAHISEMDAARIAALPAEMRPYVTPLRSHYLEVQAAQAAARSGHVEDCLKFASQAWRRPLSDKEKLALRGFYREAMAVEPDHRKAIRALLARILVSPAFLYRVELSVSAAPVRPLSNWELAGRLSYFLWSSIPDAELRRAAAAGELADPARIRLQVRRMLADPKARRLSTEFFGQWLGFYHFDQHRGVDTTRFPEFSEEVKDAMYDEAVSFFEYIVRNGRPAGELLNAGYTFLNKPLAKHYGIVADVKSADRVERFDGAAAFHRGGLLRLGAILTATSAPLRTSPVKRGDWVLRRVLGTAVPPPPADAGSIPADDKLFGGLSLREKLELHKRNATCAGCHVRIDPLGFPLERYDSIGRWRDRYPDGKPIQDSAALADKTEIAGADGLLRYLNTQERQVVKTLSNKLVGYALGRTVQASDQALIDRMAAGGGSAPFTRLVEEIAVSGQFRNRLGRETEAPPAPKTAARSAAALVNMASIPSAPRPSGRTGKQ